MHETLKLNAGLAVIRYQAGGDENNPVVIRPLVAPESFEFCTLMFDPNCEGETLTRPGQCVVARCSEPSFIDLSVDSRYRSSQSPRGSVSVEYLTKQEFKTRRVQTPAPRVSRSSRVETLSLRDVSDFGVTGHVAYQGDQAVEANEWLCGPDRPNRIEGLRMDWPSCPPGMDICYKVSGSSSTRHLGQFAGTKGQFKGISFLEVWLSGDSPENLELIGEAQFVQRGIVEFSGKGVNLSGASDRDEIIGLKLGLHLTAAPANSPSPSPSPSQRTNRVRVFRK